MDTDREMTLFEWLDQLPKGHLSRHQLSSVMEALENLIADAESHVDGDDRSMTLDVTCERARAALALLEQEDA